MDLNAWSACLRVLSDPTRVRLLALLEREELTVAELAGVPSWPNMKATSSLSMSLRVCSTAFGGL